MFLGKYLLFNISGANLHKITLNRI